MKALKFLTVSAVAALVASPALSSAQTGEGATRAEVRAELVQLQQAGYNPASDNTQYPKNIEAALARVHASQADASAAYGGTASGTSKSGAHRSMTQAPVVQDNIPGLGSIYAHS
jgi:hypothetical protein